MKRAFLLIAVPTLLVALGFAQTPAASTNPDQTNIKGCLGGSDGNYTVMEDNTGRIFKLTTSSVDLKPHLSHDVTLIGHRASGASSAAADDSFAVTELNMISEHCAVAAAAAAAAPAATTSTVAENAITPAADSTPPAETAITPAAAATPPTETAVTPDADTAAAAANVSTPSETTGTPAAHHRRRSETLAAATTTPAAIANSSPETVSTPAAAATTPAATSSTSSEPVSTPAAAATTPTATSKGWSFWLWIAVAVVVVVIGVVFPFFSRWRKRKSLERTGAPNLSFTRAVSSEPGNSDKQGPRKAA
jgi:pyruvate/2-oxoglutarate dehydrogenase complex dihydrolipoamide acyltransferase (E2) component